MFMKCLRKFYAKPKTIMFVLLFIVLCLNTVSLIAQATSDEDLNEITFAYPDDDLYMDILPVKTDKSTIVERKKFFMDQVSNDYKITDVSNEFKTLEQLQEFTSNERIQTLISDGYQSSWENIGKYKTFVLRKKATTQYLTTYLIATGKQGYDITLISPNDNGLTLIIKNSNTLAIIDNVNRPHISTGRTVGVRKTSAVCDICGKTITGGGYCLHTDDVLKTEAYIDWYIVVQKGKGIFPQDFTPNQEERGRIQNLLRQTGGDTPWLICDSCMQKIFSDILQDEKHANFAREQAALYWSGANPYDIQKNLETYQLKTSDKGDFDITKTLSPNIKTDNPQKTVIDLKTVLQSDKYWSNCFFLNDLPAAQNVFNIVVAIIDDIPLNYPMVAELYEVPDNIKVMYGMKYRYVVAITNSEKNYNDFWFSNAPLFFENEHAQNLKCDDIQSYDYNVMNGVRAKSKLIQSFSWKQK